MIVPIYLHINVFLAFFKIFILSHIYFFRYSQMICGAIRGALEMMHLEVQAAIVQEFNQNTEIRVKFIRILHESMPPGEED